MAGETTITIVGNLTADPELRYTPNGHAVANFTIASTPRVYDRDAREWRDGEPLFLRSSLWRDYAEHVASSLKKGARVIAQGKLKQRSYETREGEKRTSVELDIEEIGPALRYATAQVTRTTGGQSQAVNTAAGQQAQQQAGWPTQKPGGQGWASSGQYEDEPPF